ncbi:MAG: ATP-binding protein [Acidimicrobiales bacterium]
MGRRSKKKADKQSVAAAVAANAATKKRGRRGFRSIRSKILRRVLPIVLIPIFSLGALSLLSLIFVQNRTSEAVTSAESVLTENVVEDAVSRSADRGARELADYVGEWTQAIQRLSTRSEFRNAVSEASEAARLRNVDSMEIGDAMQAEVDDFTTITRVLALTGARELAIDGLQPQVLIVSDNGVSLGHTLTSDASLHTDDQWFRRVQRDGRSLTSFVVSDGRALFEIAVEIDSHATSRDGGVIRVRVPFDGVHEILDDIAIDSNVDALVVDTSASVLVADTENGHDEQFLYSPGTLIGGRSGANLELLQPGTHQDVDFLTAARSVRDEVDSPVAFNWLVQVNQPIEIATAPLSEVRSINEDLEGLQGLMTLVTIALLLGFLIIGAIAVRAIARRITAPVQQITEQAESAAESGIPSIVEAARTSSEDLPELPPFYVDTRDELMVLAHSLNTMQDAAVDLAAGQAKLRRQNVARTFVSLGRRNQNLLNRQLEFIDELEAAESDPDVLENLFRLDHLATRMRRNAENLLVLAGEQTPRRWAKPIAVRDVLRAAAAEIGDYTRVRLGEIDAATVSGNLATDLSHLLAELLENAGAFSPPESPIDILGQQTPTHYRLAIIDQGIGLDDAALAQANHRLANPVDFADAPSAYLGLFVVGHLARQLGITVRLAKSDPSGSGRSTGTIAFVDLPVSLLSSEAPTAIATPQTAEARHAEARAKQQAAAVTPEPASSEEVAPSVAPTAPVPEPVGRQEHTSAGFPRRVGRAQTTTTGAAPATRPAPGPSPHASPTPVPVAETTVVQPAAAPTAPTTHTVEHTSAGFPRRRATTEGDQAPMPIPGAASPSPATDVPVPQRDAASVSASLRSFRAAVAKGRADADGPNADNPDASESPPPVPPIPPNPPAQTQRSDQ